MKPRLGRTQRVLSLLSVLMLAIIPSSLCAPAHAAERSVVSSGHVDLGPRVIDGRWTFQIRDDNASPPAWRDFNELTLSVPDAAKITVPAGEAFGFLGQSGDSIYVLPQVQRNGIVWPGWNTQDPTVVDKVRGDVSWRIDSISGPGKMHLFLSDSFGTPSRIFDGSKPYPQSTSIPPNTHAHGNWAFTKPGYYTMAMTMSAKDTSGNDLSDSAELLVAVGVDPQGSPEDAPQKESTPPGDQAGAAATTGAGTAPDPAAPSTLPRTGSSQLLFFGLGAAGLFLFLRLGFALRQRRNRQEHHVAH